MSASDSMFIYEPETPKELLKLIISHKYVVVDFYVSWCGPCKMLTPWLKDNIKTITHSNVDVILILINIENENLTIFINTHKVSQLPYVVFFEDGIHTGPSKQFNNIIGFDTNKLIINLNKMK